MKYDNKNSGLLVQRSSLCLTSSDSGKPSPTFSFAFHLPKRFSFGEEGPHYSGLVLSTKTGCLILMLLILCPTLPHLVFPLSNGFLLLPVCFRLKADVPQTQCLGTFPCPSTLQVYISEWQWPRVLDKTLVFGDPKPTMKMPSIVKMLGSSRSWWAGWTAFSLWTVADESHGQRLGSLTAVKSREATKALMALGMGTWEEPQGGNAISAKVLVPGLGEALSSLSHLPLSSGCSAWDLLNEAKPEIVLTECLS